eukprot:GHVS01058208.1.p1 GENE.GHVS01058208.1~~GHVS01058208.1.p1  ORF type:complete len:469 (-),score=147.81 GHVS01058208.1:239-1594(-)
MASLAPSATFSFHNADSGGSSSSSAGVHIATSMHQQQQAGSTAQHHHLKGRFRTTLEHWMRTHVPDALSLAAPLFHVARLPFVLCPGRPLALHEPTIRAHPLIVHQHEVPAVGALAEAAGAVGPPLLVRLYGQRVEPVGAVLLTASPDTTVEALIEHIYSSFTSQLSAIGFTSSSSSPPFRLWGWLPGHSIAAGLSTLHRIGANTNGGGGGGWGEVVDESAVATTIIRGGSGGGGGGTAFDITGKKHTGAPVVMTRSSSAVIVADVGNTIVLDIDLSNPDFTSATTTTTTTTADFDVAQAVAMAQPAIPTATTAATVASSSGSTSSSGSSSSSGSKDSYSSSSSSKCLLTGARHNPVYTVLTPNCRLMDTAVFNGKAGGGGGVETFCYHLRLEPAAPTAPVDAEEELVERIVYRTDTAAPFLMTFKATIAGSELKEIIALKLQIPRVELPQ